MFSLFRKFQTIFAMMCYVYISPLDGSVLECISHLFFFILLKRCYGRFYIKYSIGGYLREVFRRMRTHEFGGRCIFATV